MSTTINKTKQFGFLRNLSGITRVMMEQGALRNYQHIITENIRNGRSAEEILADDSFRAPYLHELRTYNKKGAQTRQQYIDEALQLLDVSEDGTLILSASSVDNEGGHESEAPEEEQSVLFLHMEGPVTRGGGMCSYGSIDYRELLKEYAADPSVSGMVLCTDTPGGDAMAMYDFEDGMRAWKEAGKRSIQIVDGDCYSAGEALGCQCDYQVAVNPHNGFGCIGAMVAGWATPNGAADQSGSRFLHIVAKQTPDKNKMWQDAAEGNTDEVQDWVSESAQDFLDMMHRCRPNVNDEHMTGKIYEASQVIGSLCDGIASLDDAISYCLTGDTPWLTPPTTPTEPSTPTEGGDQSPTPSTPTEGGEQSPTPSTPTEGGEQSPTPSASSEQTIYSKSDMNILHRIAAALGITTDPASNPVNQEESTVVETIEPAATAEPAPTAEPAAPAEPAPTAEPAEPAATEEGGNQSPAPSAPAPTAEPAPTALENQLTEQVAAYDRQVTELQNTIAAHEDTIRNNENLLNSHLATISANESTIKTLNGQIEALTAELTEVKALLADCKSEIEANEASISSLTARNTELTEENDLLKQVGAAPKTPAPAPAPAQEDNEPTPDEEFKPGEMTAQELINIQKKRSSRRKKKAE